MTDALDLWRRYVRQLREVGEEELYLEAAFESSAHRPTGRAERMQSQRPEEAKSAHVPSEGAGVRREGTGGGRDWRQGAPDVPPPGIVIPSPTSDLFAKDALAECGLGQIVERVAGCTQCRLSESRTHTVPGEGPGDARLVVVGEGPGATEDETGRPFVGRAGELLTEVLRAIELPREQVYICNIVKCRPPNNRKPQQDEIDACVPYLYRQLDVISPKVILAMGGTAAETLLGSRGSLASMRNRVHSFRGTPLVVTYHPAALLRNPNWKKPTWDDVRIARQLIDR